MSLKFEYLVAFVALTVLGGVATQLVLNKIQKGKWVDAS